MEKKAAHTSTDAVASMGGQNKIFTIPNILSMFRLALIPLFIWLYLEAQYMWTGGVLILSGVTDIVDGFIARKFNAISNLGKVLDPIADKLTQVAMLACLLIRYPLMWILIKLMVVKELLMSITGMLVVRKRGHVFGAEWHGKLATILLYALLLFHVVWYDIPGTVSNFMILACIVSMCLSMVLYVMRNMRAIAKGI